MKPVYGLPGASVIGIIATYLSDNPAILTLAEDHGFRRYYKRYQLPALTNIGTAFGMGLIITTFVMGIPSISGESFVKAALIGNLGAVVGSIVSVRLMLHFSAKKYGTEEYCEVDCNDEVDLTAYRQIRPGGVGGRFMSALCGFTSSQVIAIPITALGAAGAAIGLIPKMVAEGLAGGNDIAVFTAMCMCWSGYLSTHVAMMDSLKCPEMTSKAIFSHTIGGLCAGVSAHWIYVLFSLIH